MKSTPVKSGQKIRHKGTTSEKVIVSDSCPIDSKARYIATETSSPIANNVPVTPAKKSVEMDSNLDVL